MLSIREISQHTGVSTATVSRSLDPRYAHKVHPSTRAMVLAFCDARNYRPNITGRSFVTGKTYKVGMIFGDLAADLGSPLHGRFMRGVCSVLQQHNYAPVLLHAAAAEGLDDHVCDFLRSQVADAYIIGSVMITDKVHAAIRRCVSPVVATAGASFDLPQVSVISRDSVSAYREVWRRIPEAWREQTAFTGAPGSDSDQKLNAVIAASGTNSAVPFFPLQFPFKAFSFDRHSARLAATRMLPELRRFRLLWCASDLTALGIADALSEAGIIPGRDVFLVGHDNIEGIDSFRGPAFLSTVDTLWEERGRLSAQIALQQIENRDPCRVALPSIYIPRQSFPETI